MQHPSPEAQETVPFLSRVGDSRNFSYFPFLIQLVPYSTLVRMKKYNVILVILALWIYEQHAKVPTTFC